MTSEIGSVLRSSTASPRVSTATTSPLLQEYPSFDISEPETSPYLHYTQRRAPKETHFAEVERDPVSGRKLINHYEIRSELGRGVHGKVKLGRNLENNDFVAIKIVERVSKRRRLGRTGDQETKIKREIAILKKARHPNIVGLLEVIDDPAKKKVYIILELAELGEVEWRVRGEDEICLIECRRSEREAKGVFDDGVEQARDQRILEVAHRQTQQRKRQAARHAQRNLREEQTPHIGPWSLEHGGESDSEILSISSRNYRPRQPAFTLDSRDDEDDDEGCEDTNHLNVHGQVYSQCAVSRKDKHKPTSQIPPAAKSVQAFHSDRCHSRGTMLGSDDRSPQSDEYRLFGSFASSREDYYGNHIPEQYRYVPTMTLNEARRAIQDTVLGLEYLHYNGVIHRDIKPANLLQSKEHRIKISDFGVSYLGKAVNLQPEEDDQSESDAPNFDDARELAKTVGTPAFYAPELCNPEIDTKNPPPVTNSIDVWALGVTLYCLVFGRVPFHDDSPFKLMAKIASEHVYIPRRRLKAVALPLDQVALQSPRQPPEKHDKRMAHELEYEDVPDELRDLLIRLLTKHPTERIKLSEVRQHAWLLLGIPDPDRWINENDLSKIEQGKRIEVSKEDVDVAVAPLKLSDHLLNLASKTAMRLTGALGIAKNHSRRRAKSAAGAISPTVSSNTLSSSTIGQDSKLIRQ